MALWFENGRPSGEKYVVKLYTLADSVSSRLVIKKRQIASVLVGTFLRSFRLHSF